MNLEHAVRVIGALHVLQPPLALALIRRIELGRALSSCPPLVEQVARNMAVASIALPTTLGVLLAVHAAEVVAGGPARSLAWVVAAFWSWRLARQCWARGAWRGHRQHLAELLGDQLRDLVGRGDRIDELLILDEVTGGVRPGIDQGLELVGRDLAGARDPGDPALPQAVE